MTTETSNPQPTAASAREVSQPTSQAELNKALGVRGHTNPGMLERWAKGEMEKMESDEQASDHENRAAVTLNAAGRAALERIANGVDGIGFYPQLIKLGLIEKVGAYFGSEEGYHTRYILTDAGRQVLAHPPSENEERGPEGLTQGEMMDMYDTAVNRELSNLLAQAPGSPDSGKPVETITAAEWIRVAEYVKEGMCVVKDHFTSTVKSINMLSENSFAVSLLETDTSKWQGMVGTEFDHFTVTWLPPQPTSAGAQGADWPPELAIVCRTMGDEIVHMLQGYGVSRHDIMVLDNTLWNDNIALRQQLAALRLLCGRAADDLVATDFYVDKSLIDELRAAAKGGQS